MTRIALALLAPTLLTPFASAQEAPQSVPKAESLEDALTGGRTWLNFNYRVEHVEMDSFSKEALASTLRTALGYETGAFHGLKGLIEFEDVAPIGNDLFNSTTNGETNRPVVADPNNTEINQLYASYSGIESLQLRLGRQEINFGDHRFVGNVGWRQNHQSFDAARMDWTAPAGTKVVYAYLDTVNRIFGEANSAGEEQMASHLLDVRHSFEGIGDAAAYAYYLDFDDSTTLSSMTIGARLSGDRPLSDELDLLYTGEYANQTDAGHNPVDISEDYWLAELGLGFSGVQVRLGNEHLGGSGKVGDKFSTPLATLHKFNGFADLFLNTPDTGLEDRYLAVSGKIGEVACTASYHLFESDSDNIDYGKELDLTALYPITKKLQVGAKLARFASDDAFTDTNKAMAWVTYSVL